MVDYYSQSGCSDYFSECVFGAKLGFFGAWGNYYFCINVYSQSKTIYIVKDNGVLEIKPGWGNRICVDGIRKVSYNPNAIGMQKVKIEHAQGFVMINPDKPLEFVEALREIDPNLSVEGFEQIKTN